MRKRVRKHVPSSAEYVSEIEADGEELLNNIGHSQPGTPYKILELRCMPMPVADHPTQPGIMIKAWSSHSRKEVWLKGV